MSLGVEHRAAPSRSALPLALHAEGDALALGLADAPPSLPPATATASVAERIEQALANAPSPLSVAALLKACRMRTQTVTACLAELVRAGRVAKSASGYAIARNN